MTFNLLLAGLAACITIMTSASPGDAALTTSWTRGYGTDPGLLHPAGGTSLSDRVLITRLDMPAFSDSFDLSGIGPVVSATLTVTHNGNFDFIRPDGLGEQWSVQGNGVPVATSANLSNSFYDWNLGVPVTSWVSDTFNLGASLLAALNADPARRLTVSFLDRSLSANNQFYLSSMSLTVVTEDQQNPPSPVPLPGALVLLGSGTAALAALRRRERA